MFRFVSTAFAIGLLTGIVPAMAQAPAPAPPPPPAAGRAQRPPNPTRDPHTAGYVKATELPDGTVPAPKVDGNFIIGPTHPAAPETAVQEGVPQGTIYNFTMESTDSKFYSGERARCPPAAPTPAASPGARRAVSSHPAPYTRKVAVYVPKQYVPGHGRAVHCRRGRTGSRVCLSHSII